MANEILNGYSIQDIDSAFGAVFRSLDLKEQRKALRGAMRKEGNRVRKEAMARVKAGLNDTHGNIEKGIYTRVYPNRYGSGFMVSAIPHGEKGIHTNRRGLKKPILMWADDGTKSRNVGQRFHGRKVRSKTGKWRREYDRAGHSTGKMLGKRGGALRFIDKTEEAEAGNVEKNLFETFSKNLEKAARKKGLL